LNSLFVRGKSERAQFLSEKSNASRCGFIQISAVKKKLEILCVAFALIINTQKMSRSELYSEFLPNLSRDCLCRGLERLYASTGKCPKLLVGGLHNEDLT